MSNKNCISCGFHPGLHSEAVTISINWIRVGSVDVSLADEASDLSVWLDTKLTMSTHISKMCGAAFFYLYNIRHLRKFVSKRH